MEKNNPQISANVILQKISELKKLIQMETNPVTLMRLYAKNEAMEEILSEFHVLSIANIATSAPVNANTALKELITKKGTTQQAIAEQLGIDRRILNNRMRATNNPTIRSVKKIADLLGYKIALIPKELELPEDGYEIF